MSIRASTTLNTAHSLLTEAFQTEQAILDEGLYLKLADRAPTPKKKKAKG